MKQSLQLKFSQHLALTPQLQQSIRLLQLSSQELNQELEGLLQSNPMLELADKATDGEADAYVPGLTPAATATAQPE
ncbi:MAG TPA: RNA polymerase factor sigma-54, partial [Methylophilaceae bacterium]|nr:RNA polymerase factor sigma-54 [Methylophilaceae bacterium]